MAQTAAVERDAVGIRSAQETPSRVRLPLFDGGMRTDKAPEALAPNETVQLKSLHIVAGRLVVDTGYVPFNGSYLGVAQGTFEAFYADGSSALLLFTTQTVYKYNSTVLQWQIVSLNALHTTTAAYTAGANVFALNSVTDIVIGGIVGIALDNGEQLITFVTNVAGLNVTTNNPIAAGRSVANGANVFVAIVLHGDVKRSQISAVIFPANEWIIFSNGIDPILYYYGGLVTKLLGLPANTTCGAMAVYHELLLIGNTEESGVHHPYRVRQSDLADPTQWTTGIAAIYDLLDTDDTILTLLPLGPWMIAYRESSIMRASYLGILDETLFWEYMTQLEGTQSQGAVVNVGGEHVLVGHFGVYAYQGGYTLDSIGDGVFTEFLSPTGDFNAPARITLFTVFVPDLDEVWILYPSGVSLTPSKLLRVQLENNAWSERFFADSFVAGGAVLPLDETTWTTAKGEWEDPQWQRPWDSRSLVKNVPSIVLSPAVVGGASVSLSLYEYRATTDNGVPIAWSVTTKQLGDGSQFSRWERLNVVATGADVLLEVSEDEGATFESVGTFDFGAAGAPAAKNVWLDRVSTRLQVRMSGVDPAFSLRYVDVVSIAESDW